MSACISFAFSRSIRVIEPLASPDRASWSPLANSITSNSGDPIATTSRSWWTALSCTWDEVGSGSIGLTGSGTEREPTRSVAGSLPRMHHPSTTSTDVPGNTSFRLPRTVEPETYQIEIEPDLGAASFSGTVAIDAVIHEPVQEVVLNAVELAVSDVEVRLSDGAAVA